jgi:hypothetical protein
MTTMLFRTTKMMIKNDGSISGGFIEKLPQGLICFRTLLSQSRKKMNFLHIHPPNRFRADWCART